MHNYDLTQIVVTIVGIVASTISVLTLVIRAFLKAQDTSHNYFMKSLDKKDELLNLQHKELKEVVEKQHHMTERMQGTLIRNTEAMQSNTETGRTLKGLLNLMLNRKIK